MEKKLLPVLLPVIFLIFSCKKHVTSDCLQVKLIRVTCAGKVFQVLNKNSIGVNGWRDIYNNNFSYDNVFSASNACYISSEYKVGDVLYITVVKAVASSCVQCALYDAPPGISYHVKTTGMLPCGEIK